VSLSAVPPSLRASASLLSGSSSLGCPLTSIRIKLRGPERRVKGRTAQTGRGNLARWCLLRPTTTSPSCHLPRLPHWGPAALEECRARMSTASSRPAWIASRRAMDAPSRSSRNSGEHCASSSSSSAPA